MSEPPAPEKSTDLQPGSPEKLEVMAQRYADGFHLHHPDDKTCRAEPHEFHALAFRFGDDLAPEEPE